PRAWQLVLEHVESALLDGRLHPGDHLPSERDLAAQLGVGRSSVREAVRVLEVLGLVRTQTGSGPSVMVGWMATKSKTAVTPFAPTTERTLSAADASERNAWWAPTSVASASFCSLRSR
ncbi:FadR/GntR family transcriptional regulator, partial [Rhizobium johnstonii]|uniref:FadR/GntR family transcriptional regulator n=1 Tax=Rhizobium johnstonii TaxID=3019933 RepID=UPI003F9DF6BD